MATRAQIAANRRNARKSTGPRSAEGKAVSRLNALRHGLYARQFTALDGDPAAFALFAAVVRAALGPVGPREEALCERVALGRWRLYRMRQVAAALATAGAPGEITGRSQSAGPTPTRQQRRFAERSQRPAPAEAARNYRTKPISGAPAHQ